MTTCMFKSGDMVVATKTGALSLTDRGTKLKKGACFKVLRTRPKKDGLGYLVCIETPQFGSSLYFNDETKSFEHRFAYSWYGAERFELVDSKDYERSDVEEDLYV